MTEAIVLSKKEYQSLLSDLKTIIKEGRRRAEQAANRELARTYWNVGRRIVEENLTGRAHYGESMLDDLSRDLGVHPDTLRKSVMFFKKYNISDPGVLNLPWSHYRELIGIPEKEKRVFYEQKALKEAWRRNDLVRAIRRNDYEKSKDAGRSKKTSSPVIRRPVEPTYIYRAMVERVIDGDTLLLRIDLGFQVWKEQRIRLAVIDAPPMDEAAGRKAFEYVRDRLARAEVVLVKTHKVDLYGRYVGHIFYSTEPKTKEKVFSEGQYLNQELLNKRLAKVL